MFGPEPKLESTNYPPLDDPHFGEKITQLFQNYKLSDSFVSSRRGKIRLRKYQFFIGNYLYETPYRGVMVYHGLGSGKTLTSMYGIKKLGKPAVIILPASLRDGWKNYADRFLDGVPINYISYNAPNIMDQYKKIDLRASLDPSRNNFDNKLIVIDESHGFFQNVISGSAAQALQLYRKMLEAKNIKIILLTGTPIVGDPYEIVPAFILLRGILPGGQFLFPSMRQKFNGIFMNQKDGSVKNIEIFKERIGGLTSFYHGGGIGDDIPKVLSSEIIEIGMGPQQWSTYMAIREDEKEIEKKFKYLTEEFKFGEFKKPVRKSYGIYKIKSASACNFVFPEAVMSVYAKIKKQILPPVSSKIDPSIWKKIIDEYKFAITDDIPTHHRETEIKWYLLRNLYGFDRIYHMLGDLSTKLKFLVETLLDKSRRGKKFVFSRMKILGTRIISKMLEARGFVQIKNEEDYSRNIGVRKPAFVVVDGDTKNKFELIKLYNRPENKNGDICSVILGTEVISKGVNLLCVREIYIYEGQWRYSTVEQVFGRGIRMFSHASLPKSDRTIRTYILLSTSPDNSSDLTTDANLYKQSVKRQKIVNIFLTAIKETSIDCRLNKLANDRAGKVIDCFSCENPGADKIFPYNIDDHISMGPTCGRRISNINLNRIEGYDKVYMADDAGRVYVNETADKWRIVGFLDGYKNIIFDII